MNSAALTHSREKMLPLVEVPRGAPDLLETSLFGGVSPRALPWRQAGLRPAMVIHVCHGMTNDALDSCAIAMTGLVFLGSHWDNHR